MPRYDIACANGHEQEVWRSIASRRDPCPVCGAAVELLWRSSPPSVVADSIPGGQWFENGFETPQKFYSHSDHRAALAANGCEIAAKWSGPGDQHLQRWDAVDAQTLENARVLVTRTGRARREAEPAPVPDQPIEKRTLDETFKARW